ncbi:37S ribosomal protein S22 [Vermiconidia calcicola]|uniref:37S ribosomal protein S22 n=1 Tax=Vermiconidia calcicola TaxID=1690605 RepID=A0ACC3MJM8_9PEZI|nr:37S ribosomal protein S22 [Vermiconidia calcicola]
MLLLYRILSSARATLARTRKPILPLRQQQQLRYLSASRWRTSDLQIVGSKNVDEERGLDAAQPQATTKHATSKLDLSAEEPTLSPEEAAREARKTFGDVLPKNHLSEEEYKVYKRLYGTPLKQQEQIELEQEEDGGVLVDDGAGTGVLKEGESGDLEEVEFDETEEVRLRVEEGEEAEFVPGEDDARLAGDINAAIAGEGAEEQDELVEEVEKPQRIHPLTLANRFSTSPSTLQLPKHSLVEAIDAQISGMPNVHLSEAAHRVFGGIGLPYSTSTPNLAKTKQAKPIGIDASQSQMSDIEGDVFLAALVPGMYATIMSVLVETRKRLGTAWAEGLVEKAKKNELRILDAGGAGAGILAVREMLKAEWERMHEEERSPGSTMALAEANGKAGGASVSPPLGLATVLTGSDALRKRASRLLENTTFVPRLPDYLHTEEAKKKGKFDIIIAPHTLWPLREDYLRKSHVQNLWGMLSQDGGVMLVLEKGVARGFELIAGARQMLLDTRIASSSDTDSLEPLENSSPAIEKDKAMIIAPCTNHSSCPMYKPQGMVKGRRDICHFNQRYVRPPFLQNILGAKDKNWEDVKFSYFSVMRGRDLREEKGLVQDEEVTQRAFEGYREPLAHDIEAEAIAAKVGGGSTPHSLILPRMILPPLKRRGHVIVDVCTPAATLERWIVPRSFDDGQPFRDARKSSWGDIWALGAKTRVQRTPKVKKRKSDADFDVKATTSKNAGLDVDEYGRIVTASQGTEEGGDGGKLRTGRKVKGLRDKRDKKGSGNGRRKNRSVDAA